MATVRASIDVLGVPAREVTIEGAANIESITDSDLVHRGRDGDERALETIYRRYVMLVAGIARRMLRAASDVDDVVQDTFMAAFSKLRTLHEPAALRGWLAQIAVSKVHRRFRWRRFTNLLSGSDPHAVLELQADRAVSPEQLAELALIDRALAKLPLKLRMPWTLRHVMGMALDEIAIACQCSLATTKRRIAEADDFVSRYLGAGDEP
ncbi:MAG: RNA polymerase sigma factor [Kofleriaceae bacterium]